MVLPGIRKTGLFLGLALAISVEFLWVYSRTNSWASQQTHLFHFYFAWESAIPFIPSFIYVYVSLNLLMMMTVFFLSERELVDYTLAGGMAILIAAIFFIFLPAEPLFQRPLSPEGLPIVYNFFVSLDRPHNLFPSLHIALSTLTVAVLIPQAGAVLKGFFFLWWILICFSVLLTHQHQILDILGGIILAAVCYLAFFKKYFGIWLRKSWNRISA